MCQLELDIFRNVSSCLLASFEEVDLVVIFLIPEQV